MGLSYVRRRNIVTAGHLLSVPGTPVRLGGFFRGLARWALRLGGTVSAEARLKCGRDHAAT